MLCLLLVVGYSCLFVVLKVRLFVVVCALVCLLVYIVSLALFVWYGLFGLV